VDCKGDLNVVVAPAEVRYLFLSINFNMFILYKISYWFVYFHSTIKSADIEIARSIAEADLAEACPYKTPVWSGDSDLIFYIGIENVIRECKGKKSISLLSF